MSILSPLTTKNINLNKENIITTPYEKVLSIINDTIRYINMTSKTQGKLIKELIWVLKIISSHSLYTYELKENDIIEKYSNENPDFKQFVEFINEYNEEVIQMNKKTNIINSKSFKIPNQLQIPSFKLKKKNIFNSNTNSIFRNKDHLKINDENLTYSYSPNGILKNSKNLQLNSLRNVIQNSKPSKIINMVNSNDNYQDLKNLYKSVPHLKSMDLTKKPILMKLEPFSKSITLTSNNDINYNNKYHTNKNLKEIVIMPDIIYNNNSEIHPKTEIKKRTLQRISSICFPLKTIEDSFTNLNTIISDNHYNPKQILAKDFNIFQLKSLVGYDNVLPLMGKTILEAFGLTNDQIIQTNKLDSFLFHVNKQYNQSVLYHNALHGADVTHTICLFFLNSNAEKICDTNVLDILSIFIAALGHDIGHPGLTNGFHINALTEIALTYNDISCLENFHASKLFRLLRKEENNIFEKFSNDERRLIRKRIISEILATDMANHGKILSFIKAKILVQVFEGQKKEKKFELFTQKSNKKFQEQQELLDFFVHAADLAHNTKLFNISIQWVELLSNEFLLQGDKEKSMSLPVSFLCDREGYDVPTSQVGFIKGFIIPTFDILVSIFPTLNYTVENARINLGKWEELVSQHKKTGWTQRSNSKKKTFSKNQNYSNSKFNKKNSQKNIGNNIQSNSNINNKGNHDDSILSLKHIISSKKKLKL